MLLPCKNHGSMLTAFKRNVKEMATSNKQINQDWKEKAKNKWYVLKPSSVASTGW